MIKISTMNESQVNKLPEVDRSEFIDLIYEMNDGQLKAITSGHECPNWDEHLMSEIQERFVFELRRGGMAVGAFDEDRLVGFGVLAHRFRGVHRDRLQVDLMYVSKNYRRRGIGTQIMDELMKEARKRGAKQLYISSTETRSAVSFYKSTGSKIAEVIDEELFNKEPKDIHMTIDL